MGTFSEDVVRELERKKKQEIFRKIDKDFIGRQANGLYCKWSVLADTVTRINMTEESYRKFWIKTYTDHVTTTNRGRNKLEHISPEEEEETIAEINKHIDILFAENILPLEEIERRINLSLESEKDKKRLLKEINRKTMKNLKCNF